LVSDQTLISAPIPITSAVAKLTYRQRWAFEFNLTTCYDASTLDIKIGAGAFTDIVTAGGSFVSNGYNGTVSTGFSNPLGGKPAWCFQSTGYPAYLTTVVNLPASAAGQTIVLRRYLGTDSSTGAAGGISTRSRSMKRSTPASPAARRLQRQRRARPTAAIPKRCVHATGLHDSDACTTDTCAPATGCVYADRLQRQQCLHRQLRARDRLRLHPEHRGVRRQRRLHPDVCADGACVPGGAITCNDNAPARTTAVCRPRVATTEQHGRVRRLECLHVAGRLCQQRLRRAARSIATTAASARTTAAIRRRAASTSNTAACDDATLHRR
jgi:hypothetical protein